MLNRKKFIAVIGGGQCSPEEARLAEEVGRELARRGAILVCGGLGGVMEAACKGAKDKHGLTIGILPQGEFESANKFCDVVIPTGIGFSRNFIVATSVDGIIVVGGGVGTLIEISVGYMLKKMMIAMSGSGGIADEYGGKYIDERKRIKILKRKNPQKAVHDIIIKNQVQANNNKI